ncbi:MAG: hypothetical protein ACKV19_02240 [Verrucomicrobiales bacterium]
MPAKRPAKPKALQPAKRGSGGLPLAIAGGRAATFCEVVKYALSRTASPTLIEEYQTQLPERALLLRKLHEFYGLAQSATEANANAQPRKPGKSP